MLHEIPTICFICSKIKLMYPFLMHDAGRDACTKTKIVTLFEYTLAMCSTYRDCTTDRHKVSATMEIRLFKFYNFTYMYVHIYEIEYLHIVFLVVCYFLAFKLSLYLFEKYFWSTFIFFLKFFIIFFFYCFSFKFIFLLISLKSCLN